MTKLTKTERLEVENNILEQENLKLQIELRKLRKNNNILTESIKRKELEERVKNANNAADSEISKFESELKSVKDRTRQTNKKIESKYKLSGNWGINPDTGEIVD